MRVTLSKVTSLTRLFTSFLFKKFAESALTRLLGCSQRDIIFELLNIFFLFDIKYSNSNQINFFYNIIIPQYISLSLLLNFGVLGNPNHNTKNFLKDADVSSIINSNTIYLFSVDSKIETLLSYYLPSSMIVDDFEVISKYKYVITSNSNLLKKLNLNQFFIPVKKFDNHLLLVNIGK